MENKPIVRLQIEVCKRFGADFVESAAHQKVGISRSVKHGALPVNGMRLPIEAETCGWYLWGGEELSQAPDFFLPLHVDHVASWSPLVMPYLGLPPGWRFLVTPTYEDVWYDATLCQPNAGDRVALGGINLCSVNA